MLNRIPVVTLFAASVFALSALATAQTRPVDRFTFRAQNAPAGVMAPDAKWEVIINRWSTDADRERVVAAFAEGQERLAYEISQGQAIGYIKWPGNTEYTIRYAHRVPANDGSEQIVLGVDHAMTLWWQDKAPASPTPYTIIQVRLPKGGVGEGKLSLSGKVAADKTAKAITIEDYASQPVVLSEVRRDS
jgi:hypothetical protein